MKIALLQTATHEMVQELVKRKYMKLGILAMGTKSTAGDTIQDYMSIYCGQSVQNRQALSPSAEAPG
jgi:hypothetical protein